jgi:lipoprotein signal peptidase
VGALFTALALVFVLDQTVKAFVLRRLRVHPVHLGPFGKLDIVRTRIWMARVSPPPPVAWLWCAWALAAGALFIATWASPSSGRFAGLILGGSLSHLVETSRQGWICDYICLRFWPAFNLADVALTAGAIGLALSVVGG